MRGGGMKSASASAPEPGKRSRSASLGSGSGQGFQRTGAFKGSPSSGSLKFVPVSVTGAQQPVVRSESFSGSTYGTQPTGAFIRPPSGSLTIVPGSALTTTAQQASAFSGIRRQAHVEKRQIKVSPPLTDLSPTAAAVMKQIRATEQESYSQPPQ
jgi:hypothetical protein